MSAVALVFLGVPSVDTAFLLLTSAAVILYCAMYLMLFAAAIRLRYSEPDAPRPYRVPGGRAWGLWLVAGTGFVTTAVCLAVGLLPPDQGIAAARLCAHHARQPGGHGHGPPAALPLAPACLGGRRRTGVSPTMVKKLKPDTDLAPTYGSRAMSEPVPKYALPDRRDGAAHGLPTDPRRADAGRQCPAQSGHLRHHLDGTGGRAADGRDLRQEHDRQGRVSRRPPRSKHAA